MTDLYWVGGTGSFNDADHWSATSGGPGGEGVPSDSDDIFFDANSSPTSYEVTVSGTASCGNMTWACPATGFPTLSGILSTLKIYGSARLVAGMTVSGFQNISFYASIVATITSMGVVWGCVNMTFNRRLWENGDWTLQDDLVTSGKLAIYRGTFDANSCNVTANSFLLTAMGVNDPIVKMGSGTWEAVSNDVDVGGNTWALLEFPPFSSINFSSGTSTIKFTDSSIKPKTFYGGNKNYYNLWLTGTGTGEFIISNSNTFSNLKCDRPPHTIKFNSGSTTTITLFTITGQRGKPITIGSSTPGTSHNLVKSGGGVVDIDYLLLSDSVAAPALTWYAGSHSIDNHNNGGWLFSPLHADVSLIRIDQLDPGTTIRVMLPSSLNLRSKIRSMDENKGLSRILPNIEKHNLQHNDWRRLRGTNRLRFIANVIRNDVPNRELTLEFIDSWSTKNKQMLYEIILPYRVFMRISRLVPQGREITLAEEAKFRHKHVRSAMWKQFFHPLDRFVPVSLVCLP